MRGRYLETMTWPEAEQALVEYPVVLIPLGARLKEHGHHLPLNNDWVMAEYLALRVVDRVPVLAVPTVQYNYYPAFVEYPGSVHVNGDTSRDLVMDICRSLFRHGARKFYVLNTGVSTNKSLGPARSMLRDEGITMEFTDLLAVLSPLEAQVRQQEGGTHADEMETSMMLYIAPHVVQMDRARKDYQPDHGRSGGLTRNPASSTGIYSPTGVWGDPTLATVEKGRFLVEGLIDALVVCLEEFRK